MENIKVPVVTRTLMARVQRRLNTEGQKLKKCLPHANAYPSLGEYYIVSSLDNTLVATHQDLGTLGKELGVIKPYEVLVEEKSCE